MTAIKDPIAEIALATRADRPWIAGATLLAISLHAGIGSAFARGRDRLPKQPDETTTLMIDWEPPKPLALPELVTPAEAKMEPTLHDQARAVPKGAAPAQPAHAAAVLTQIAQPNAPLDLTSSDIVTGSAASYVGGATTPSGTNTRATVGAVGPRPSARATAGLAGDKDVSRSASAIGGEWKCPFPAAADANGVDTAVATLRVDVDPIGQAAHIIIVSDPGNGFGSAAARCASAKHWSPALARSGAPIPGTVTIRVHFDR